MLVRIVKMSFKSAHIADFQEIFDANKHKIRAFKGCRFLELYQDRKSPGIFFTYSNWDDGGCLEDYRNSELFKNVWAKTKVLFHEKAEAWSVDKIESLG